MASSLDGHNLIALVFIPKMRYFEQCEFSHSGLKSISKHQLNKIHNYSHERTEVNRPVRCFMTDTAANLKLLNAASGQEHPTSVCILTPFEAALTVHLKGFPCVSGCVWPRLRLCPCPQSPPAHSSNTQTVHVLVCPSTICYHAVMQQSSFL